MEVTAMRGSLEHRARIATALVLGAAALGMILVAFQERATADFLTSLGRRVGFQPDTGSGAYYVAFWFDIVIALGLLGAVAGVGRIGSRAWFGLAVLLASFTLGSCLAALLSGHGEVRTPVPAPLAAGVVAGLGLLGLLGGLTGLASLPPLPPQKPANPPVPPSHQAG